MSKSIAILIAALGMMAVSAPVAGNEPHHFLEYCRTLNEVNAASCKKKFFVVDKHGALLFEHGRGESVRRSKYEGEDDSIASSCTAHEIPADGPSLGEVFFAVEETDERVLVGRVYDTCPWQEIGWMQKTNLLENRHTPLTIDELRSLPEGLNPDLNIRISDNMGGLAEQGRRYLRVVTQPERGVPLGKRPGDESGERILKWRWYYVYDVEIFEGSSWLLVGDTSAILGNPQFEDTSEQQLAKNILLGWLPIDSVTIWASNLALELNTASAAVAKRLLERMPAKVLSECVRLDECREESKEGKAWTEPLDKMWTHEVRATDHYKAVLDVDPRGLDPTVPRLHVIQSREKGYYEVVSSAATESFSLSDIAQAIVALQQAASHLRKLDVVFLVDSTGSMKDEINAVENFLIQIARSLQQSSTGQNTSVRIGAGRKVDVIGGLDIRVSLVSYQDVRGCADSDGIYETRTFFSMRDIIRDRDIIISGLRSLSTQLAGRCEALHQGLLEALNPRHSRGSADLGVVEKLIIVLADEPGDSDIQSSVFEKMPFPTEAQLSLHPRWRKQIRSEVKREMSKIHAIYFGDTGYDTFRHNLKLVANMNDVVYSGPILNPGMREALIDKLDSMLITKRKEIDTQIKYFDQYLQDTTKGTLHFDALPGIGPLKLREAVARMPANFDKALDVVSYTGILHNSNVSGLDSGGITGASDEVLDGAVDGTAPWRWRVLLNKDEVWMLKYNVRKVVDGLKRSLVETEHRPLWVEKDNREETRRELVVRLILLLVDQVADLRRYKGEAGQENLKRDISIFFKYLNAEHEYMDNNLSSVMNLQGNLPYQSGGLLSMSLKEAVKKTRSWYEEQLGILQNKAKGLDQIDSGLSVPEDPNRVRVAQAVRKHWFGQLGTSLDQFAYIPIGYIP